MKKVCILMLAFFFAITANAQPYFKLYPLSYTKTTNGVQYRLECSVYDSLTASYEYYNTSYYDTIVQVVNNGGIVGFNALNCNVDDEGWVVFVTYDFGIHQWVKYEDWTSNCYLPPFSISNGNISYDAPNDYDDEFAGYYNIVGHNFLFAEADAHSSCPSAYISLNGLFIHTEVSGDYDHEAIYFKEYLSNQYFYPLVSALGDPGTSVTVGTSGISALAYYSYGLGVGVFDVGNVQNYFAGYDCDFIHSNGTYVVQDYLTGNYRLKVYDAQLGKWTDDTIPVAGISNHKVYTNTAVFVNTTNSLVVCAVFDYNLHHWVYDSVATGSVSLLAIANGLVQWNDGGNLVTRGYDPVNGWGNYLPTLTPYYYVQDLSLLTGSNVIFIRDYSLGSTNVSVSFGDGTSGSSNDWHFYKKNGTYLSNGVSLHDSICYTAYNGANSVTTCGAINCTMLNAVVSGNSKRICLGDSVALKTNSEPGLAYQWHMNGIALNNATDSIFYATLAGNYSCTISNNCRAFNSNTFILAVDTLPPNVILSSTTPTTFCYSDTSYIRLTLNPVQQGLIYSLYRDTTLQHSYNPYYPPTNPITQKASIGNHSYYYVVSNGCGVDTSNILSFQANGLGPLSISSDYGFVCQQSITKLYVPYFPGFTYQWLNNATPIAGATDTLYNAFATGYYRCLISDSMCSYTTEYFHIYSFTLPANYVNIAAYSPTSFCEGEHCTLKIVSTNYGYANIQWMHNGVDIPGENKYYCFADERGAYSARLIPSYPSPIPCNIPPVSNKIFTRVVCAPPISPDQLKTGYETAEDNPHAYPTIFSNSIFISFNNEQFANGLQIELSDLSGREIIYKSAVKSGNEINTSNLSNGMYVLKMYDRQKLLQTYKVIKQ